MYVNIINFFAYLIESFILLYYFKHLFTQRRTSTLYNISIIFLGYACCFLLSFIPISLVNPISFLLMNTLLILLLNEAHIYTAIFHSFILTCIMGGSEMIVMNTLHISSAFKTSSNISKVIMLCIVSKFIYFFIVILLSNIFSKKENTTFSSRPAIWLNIIPFTSVITLFCFTMIIYRTTLPVHLEYFMAVSAFGLLIMNLFIFWYYDAIIQKEAVYAKLKLEYEQEKCYVAYQNRLNKQYESNRLLIHDIKKHLAAINDLATIGDVVRIKSYVDYLIDSADLKENIQVSDNDFFNALILRYTDECQKHHINFYANIRSNTIDFMSENDITSIFCNLIENAMEAINGSANAYIELTVKNNDHNKNMLIIAIKNTCYDNPFSSANTLVSKKSDSNFHGLGLRIIKNTVQKYNGDVNCRYDEQTNFFHVTIYMYKTSDYLNNPIPKHKRN